MSFVYEKYCGTGNDFLIVDIRNREKDFSAHILGNSRSLWAQKLCDRHFGLGADGLVIIENATREDIKWDFYNSDGSSAEMCGNAARCIGKWGSLHHPELKPLKVETLAGPIAVDLVDEGQFQVKMSPILKSEFRQQIALDDEIVNYSYVDSGVPHIVIKIQNIQQAYEKKKLARLLRQHKHFAPRGSNVTFYAEKSESEIDSISFERGVEDFTLACGTGAVAAAYVHYKENKRGEISVHLPGGDLKIRFLGTSPLLIGPAIKIADCTLSGYTE